MTVKELQLIRQILISDDDDELGEAIRIIDREIKLRTTNYVTGERIEETE